MNNTTVVYQATKEEISALAKSYYDSINESQPPFVDQLDQDMLANFPTRLEEYFLERTELLNAIATPRDMMSFVFGLTQFTAKYSLDLVSSLNKNYEGKLLETSGDPEMIESIFGDFSVADLIDMMKDALETALSLDPDSFPDIQFEDMQLENDHVQGHTLYQLLSANTRAMKITVSSY
jgi:hypothetical protein